MEDSSITVQKVTRVAEKKRSGFGLNTQDYTGEHEKDSTLF